MWVRAAIAVGLLVVFPGLVPALAAPSGGIPVIDTRAVLVGPGEVRRVAAGRLTAEQVTQPPSEVDLRVLRVTPAGAGYAVRFEFAGAFQHRRGTGWRHEVYASLVPPDGGAMRVVLLADGTGALGRVLGNGFTPLALVTPAIDGNAVTLPVPPSAGMAADWDVQGHALLLSGADGFHAHTPPVAVGALTGEGDATRVPFPATASPVERGQPLLWRPGRPMPAAARPSTVRLERRGDRIAAVVRMTGGVSALSTLDGQPVGRQEVRLVFEPAGPTVTWAANGDEVGGGVRVAVEGQDLVLSLASVPPGSSLTVRSVVLDRAGTGLTAATPTVPLRQWIPLEAPPPASRPGLADRWPLLLGGLLVLLAAGVAAWRLLRVRAGPGVDPADDDEPGCDAERAAVRAAEAAYEVAQGAVRAAESRVTAAEQAINTARERLAVLQKGYAPTQTAYDRTELRRDVPGIALPHAADPAQEAWEEVYLVVLYAEEELKLRVVELADAQRGLGQREADLSRSSAALVHCRTAGAQTGDRCLRNGSASSDLVND